MMKKIKGLKTGNWGKRSKAKSAHLPHERREVIGAKLGFAASEAYKLLRTNLIFSMSDASKCKIIGVTSALPGEGKSSTAINLSYSFAETGKNVLFLEADMRIPVIAKILQIPESPGLSNVLARVNTLNDAIRSSMLLKSLYVLPGGEIPPNPSELLSSVRMERLIKTLSTSFDYIIIDLPPVNAVGDSLAVSKLLNGMLMVVRQNYCDRNSLAEAMRQLELLKVKLLGFVMTDVEQTGTRYKRYRNTYRNTYTYQREEDERDGH
ncbi:MAG: CpsD/CapB family tyrosine-protein kinase [Fastidiosipilaceae bacterium]|jgi:capsular exopolysaccharide synthesis family protein